MSDQVAEWKDALCERGGFRMFPAAERALRTYGKLRVSQRGPGIDCARSSFVLDPILAEGMEDVFQELASRVGQALFPLGEVDGGHAFLCIGEDGHVFLAMDDVMVLAASIEDGFEALIRGVRPLRRDDLR